MMAENSAQRAKTRYETSVEDRAIETGLENLALGARIFETAADEVRRPHGSTGTENNQSRSRVPRNANTAKPLIPGSFVALENSESALIKSGHELRERGSEDFGLLDSDSDSDSIDSEVELQRPSFYQKEAESSMILSDWEGVESATRKIFDVRQSDPEMVTLKQTTICYLLWLGVAQFAQGDIGGCFQTLEQINIPSTTDSKGKASEENMSYAHMKARKHLLSAVALMVVGRLEEARSRCQRTMKSVKRLSSMNDNGVSARLAIFDGALGVDDFAGAPIELMVLIVENIGDALDTKFYRSMLSDPKGEHLFRGFIDSAVRKWKAFGGPKGGPAIITELPSRNLELQDFEKSKLRAHLGKFNFPISPANPAGHITIQFAPMGPRDHYNLFDLFDTAIQTEQTEPELADILFRKNIFLHDGQPVHAYRVGIELPDKCFDWSPLHIAAHRGAYKTAARLLALGADLQAFAQSDSGSRRTPLHILAYSEEADSDAYLKTAEVLLSKDRSLNEVLLQTLDSSRQTPTMIAARRNHSRLLLVFLKHGADMDQIYEVDRDKIPMLCKLAMGEEGRGCLDSIRVLLKAGANVNATTVGGYTALHFALRWGQKDIASLLLRFGAKCPLCESGKTEQGACGAAAKA